MSILNEKITESILKEAGKNSAYDKYVKNGNISEKIFKDISLSLDEGYHKYLEWIMKQIKELGDNYDSLKDKQLLLDEVIEFDKYKTYMDNKDIFSYNIDTILDSIDNAKDKKLELEIKKQNKLKPLYDKNGIKLYKINKYEHCYTYGSGTQWCINDPKDPFYWKRYSNHGQFYFLINNNLPSKSKYSKIAILQKKDESQNELISSSIWDANDQILFYDEFEKYLNEWNIPLKKYINISEIFKQYRIPGTEYATFFSNDKFGLMNREKVILPAKYDYIEPVLGGKYDLFKYIYKDRPGLKLIRGEGEEVEDWSIIGALNTKHIEINYKKNLIIYYRLSEGDVKVISLDGFNISWDPISLIPENKYDLAYFTKNGFQAKRIDDGKWYDFDEEGNNLGELS